MIAAFVRLEWENAPHTIASAYLKPASTYRYEAGQYADIIVPHNNPDTRGTSRVMTLSSSPDDELLQFTFKYYGDAGSTFKRAIMALRPGDLVTVRESLGDLVLPLDPRVPLVWIAGGVGIASFSGMTRYLTDHHDQRDITLHYAVARYDDTIMEELFKAYPLTRIIYTPVVNIASTHTLDESDMVIRKLEAADILSTVTLESLLYLSGTETMVESLRNELEQAGIPRSRIIFDYYEGYSEL